MRSQVDVEEVTEWTWERWVLEREAYVGIREAEDRASPPAGDPRQVGRSSRLIGLMSRIPVAWMRDDRWAWEGCRGGV